jgi:hypothetical protein
MWQPAVVERALFKWPKWRRSIIMQWIRLPDGQPKLHINDLKMASGQELRKLGLSSVSPLFDLYWICCVASDYNMDYESTFKNIIVPPELPLPPNPMAYEHYPELGPGSRMYPPMVSTSKDRPFYLHNFEFALHVDRIDETSCWIFIEDDHELVLTLNKMRGRPRKSHAAGAIPLYSDRLAVACAVLKNSGSTNVEIAKRFHLHFSKPYLSEQSEIVRHLVKRGVKLLSKHRA